MFWGLVVFMPVGVTYLAAILLLLALLGAGGWRERIARLRTSPLWWPVMAYVTWTLLVLATQPHYPQTASNLAHGLRIALTILMALALTRTEALWALRGFVLMALVNMGLIALYYSVGFPLLEPWRAVLVLGALLVAGLSQLPAVQQNFQLGLSEVAAAQAGTVSEGSWVVRYYMYRDTAQMIIDKPLAGWGIGGWTQQWLARAPALLADYNMPHNDFLWMGAQAGLPGLLCLLSILLTGVWQAWRRPDMAGRLALAATLIALVATSLNSALRDAQIGLSLLWVVVLYLRLTQEAPEAAPWRDLWPRRRQTSAPKPSAVF